METTTTNTCETVTVTIKQLTVNKYVEVIFKNVALDFIDLKIEYLFKVYKQKNFIFSIHIDEYEVVDSTAQEFTYKTTRKNGKGKYQGKLPEM